MVSGPRGDLLVDAVSAWCEGRATERASGLQIGPGARGREGGLEAERGISCGCCECLVRGKGSREGELDANRAMGLEGGRVVSGPRGEFLVGAMSACCEGRAAERASWMRIGPGV